MDNVETTIAGAAVDEAVAVDMEEDVGDTITTNPTSMILTASYPSSLP